MSLPTPSIIDWLTHPAGRLLTFALFHFLWQGAAVAGALTIFVELLGVRRSTSRYACSLAALIAMIFCPIATSAWYMTVIAASPASVANETASNPAASVAPNLKTLLQTGQPYALAAWLTGVTVFGARILAGALGLSRLSSGRLPLSAELADSVERLGRRLKVDALPLVFLSRQVSEAVAVGVLRPLVLIPASWTTEMPLEMLEAVIAHELAHLRRRDLWINLFQRITETLLFYHPAVWWLSRRLRMERELCCDELAVAATGQRLLYVEALETVARRQAACVEPALAAGIRGEKNMRLLERVRNVLDGSSSVERSRFWPVGLAALGLPLLVWAASIGLFGPTSSAVTAGDERKEGRSAVHRERDDDDDDDRASERKKGKKNDHTDDADDEKRVGDKNAAIKKGRKEKEDGDDDADEKKEIGKKKATQIKEPKESRIVVLQARERVETEKNARESGNHDDRRIDELAGMIKRLSQQVERLQGEVQQLRGERGRKESGGDANRKDEDRARDKEAAEKRELELNYRRLRESREEAEAQAKRAGELSRAAEQKARAIMEQAIAEKVRAAHQQSEQQEKAAREKAEAELERAEKAVRGLEPLKKKIEALKAQDIDAEELIEILKKSLKDQQALLGRGRVSREPAKEKPVKTPPPKER